MRNQGSEASYIPSYSYLSSSTLLSPVVSKYIYVCYLLSCFRNPTSLYQQVVSILYSLQYLLNKFLIYLNICLLFCVCSFLSLSLSLKLFFSSPC